MESSFSRTDKVCIVEFLSFLTCFELKLRSNVEMFIGVICVCMPSVSKMLHHHHSQLQECKTFMASLLMTFSRKKTTHTGASYKSHNFTPLNDIVVSKITGGESDQALGLANDVIKLTHDIEQLEYQTQTLHQASVMAQR